MLNHLSEPVVPEEIVEGPRVAELAF